MNKYIPAMTYRKVKIGAAFTFLGSDAVWIKCKGGFRPGRGGQLHSCQARVSVVEYKTECKTPMEAMSEPKAKADSDPAQLVQI